MSASHDPFDLWALPSLGRIKDRWYRGSRSAKAALYVLYLLDWFAPTLTRRVLGVSKNEFAHSLALQRGTPEAPDTENFITKMEAMRHDHAWGLPFAWYSKNGTYPANIPLVTSAPYVFQALLDIPSSEPQKDRAMALFNDTWFFLESLHVHVDTDSLLALSYAPFDDAFLVVNANSYAAWAYAMHAEHGLPERRPVARDKALRLANWVVAQQNADGSWYYLAQRGDWDMIDGFHSCFVVRNLRNAGVHVPEITSRTAASVQAGWDYIRTHIYDAKSGLCRRYALRHRADPFRYDIYDQAEYLGLLIDFDELDEARSFARSVTPRFRKGRDWYCRIDLFGRRWGRNFLRWGIIPYQHHLARLEHETTRGTT